MGGDRSYGMQDLERDGIHRGFVNDDTGFMAAKNLPKNSVQLEELNVGKSAISWLKLCLTHCEKFRLIWSSAFETGF